MTDMFDGSVRNRSGGLRRVAIVSHSSSLYGAGRSLLELVRSLISAGLEVGVVLPRGGMLEQALRQYQCQLWHAQLPPWTHTLAVDTTLAPTRRELSAAANNVLRELRGWGADLLWSNSSITPVGALVARSLGIPHVWHLRELNGRKYGYEFGIGGDAAAQLLSTASCRVAVSRTVKAFYENLGCGHCEWVYNGIGSGARLATRRAKRRSSGMSRLVIVGRVMEGKGQSTAIEAIGKLRSAGRPAFLRVVGDGDIESCRKLAHGLDIHDRVEFTGFSEHMDEHYRWADIALSCASFEAMGRSTAEAMSWGLPVAGHCRAGTGELVGDAGAGLLYDGSAGHLAQVITALIDDPVKAGSMGEAGQRWARTHCSSERHASQIMEIVGALSYGPCVLAENALTLVEHG